MFPSVQAAALGQDPPPSDGPRFTLHQKVKAPRDRSETAYTCWIVEVFYGTNGVPVTYRIRFSKMKVSDDEIFTETVIETHPHRWETRPKTRDLAFNFYSVFSGKNIN